jgi:Ohr subfamily peroxiredoxin
MVQPLASEIYTAHLHITGGREGHGRSSDGVLDLQLATPGTGKPGTNPEQLFGIGYSACFLSAMHIGALQQKFRLPKEASVNADVTLGKTAAGDYQLKLVLNIDLPGVDEGMKRQLVEYAHRTCPYSRATHGDIEVEDVIIGTEASAA